MFLAWFTMKFYMDNSNDSETDAYVNALSVSASGLTVAADATVQQAAALAANLASQVHRWAEFRATLRPHANGDVKALVLRALALGWSEKWRTS